ncbi:6493_t:CDS:2, partial [Cetraspora pellucida]
MTVEFQDQLEYKLLQKLYQIQKNFAPFEHIILYDILIYINFVILQNEDYTRTIEIPTTGNKNSRITPLISPFKIKSFILQLCDKDLACKKSFDILISDLLVDKNLCKIKFNTRKVKVELKSEITIECSACDFIEHELIICLDFKKMLVCFKNKPSNTESSFFDKENFLFVIFLNYMDSAYSFKKRTVQNKKDAYLLDEKHNFNTLNVGISGFMTDGYIEMSWSPHLRGVDFNKIMSQIGNCCDSNNNIKP